MGNECSGAAIFKKGNSDLAIEYWVVETEGLAEITYLIFGVQWFCGAL